MRWTEENLEDDKGNLGLERELEQELEADLTQTEMDLRWTEAMEENWRQTRGEVEGTLREILRRT